MARQRLSLVEGTAGRRGLLRPAALHSCYDELRLRSIGREVHAFCTVVLHLSWQDVSKLFDLGHAIVGTDTNHKKTDV